MHYAFDLDGTLVDTRLAVKTAYRMAGVEMPDLAWGRPWREWLTDRAAHTKKNEVYPDALRLHARLIQPLFAIACEMKAPILTGASSVAIRAIEDIFRVSLNIQLCGADSEMKAAWLNRYRRGIYIDDDAVARRVLSRRTQWTIMSPQDFLQSFSPQAQTRV